MPVGALPLVSALLKAGANPNLCDRTGASCVAMASSAGHAHVLKRLLELAQDLQNLLNFCAVSLFIVVPSWEVPGAWE